MKNHEVTPLEVPQVICATTSKAAAQPRPSANFKKTRSEGPHPSRMAVAHGGRAWRFWSRMVVPHAFGSPSSHASVQFTDGSAGRSEEGEDLNAMQQSDVVARPISINPPLSFTNDFATTTRSIAPNMMPGYTR